jgi:hypothetical protein
MKEGTYLFTTIALNERKIQNPVIEKSGVFVFEN